MQIRLQGDASEALAAPAQLPRSLPPARQQPLAPRIAAFSSAEQDPEPGGDVDMEEI